MESAAKLAEEAVNFPIVSPGFRDELAFIVKAPTAPFPERIPFRTTAPAAPFTFKVAPEDTVAELFTIEPPVSTIKVPATTLVSPV